MLTSCEQWGQVQRDTLSTCPTLAGVYRDPVREVELWERMNEVLPAGYALTWAESVVLEELGSRTVREALAAGLSSKQIWRAVWKQLELPGNLR